MNMNQIEHIVGNYIVRHNMWKHDGFYIVALSGGADSVALLLILKSIGMPVEAAHCNFHLRGEESDRDEQFCVDLCEREGIALHRIHFDTFTYAEKHKVSIEMAARDLRYRYFAQLAKDINANGICVAHHRAWTDSLPSLPKTATFCDRCSASAERMCSTIWQRRNRIT